MKNRLDLDENRKRAELFCNNEIYTFISEYLPTGEVFQRNGFILEIKNNDAIHFFDVVRFIQGKRADIFLRLESCVIDYNDESRVNEKKARKLYEKWEGGE